MWGLTVGDCEDSPVKASTLQGGFEGSLVKARASGLKIWKSYIVANFKGFFFLRGIIDQGLYITPYHPSNYIRSVLDKEN